MQVLSSFATTGKPIRFGPRVIRLFDPFEALHSGRTLSDLRLCADEALLAFLAIHLDQAAPCYHADAVDRRSTGTGGFALADLEPGPCVRLSTLYQTGIL